MTDNNPRNAAVQWDGEESAYYIVVGDNELGPLTEEELRDVTNCCATEFGYSGQF